jgi:predicted KAP-like P-loop ATPase
MRLFPRELDIPPEEGFDPAKDIFRRQEFGSRLTTLVCQLEGPAVLVLDAPWGSGKTTFIRMWRGQLSNAGIPVIYHDAFANDYQSDAFLALATEIVAIAQKELSNQTAALRSLTGKVYKISKILLRSGTRLASGLDAGDIQTILEEGEKSLDDLHDQLKETEDHRVVFDEFRSTLTNLASQLIDRTQRVEKRRPASLVFVIDELDRCRPPYALSLLEKIKHFFSVDNVIFLLPTNLQQLETSVKAEYGAIDAHTYLEKFYHLRIAFPDISSVPDTYLNHLYDQLLPQSNSSQAFVDSMKEELGRIARARNLSLRTLERIVTYLALLIVHERASPLRTGSLSLAFVH